MIRIAYSAASAPSAIRLQAAIAELGQECELVRNFAPVDINWGRARANATLNADTSKATNKRLMRIAFRDAHVPMPVLYFLANNGDTDALQFPAIGRPDMHTRGRGFWKVNNHTEVARALRGRTYRNGTRKQAATHFMEYVSPERAPYEYRVHVFMGKVIRVSEKAFDGTAQGNHRHYETVSAQGRELGHVRNAAKLAIHALGLDFGAVDVLASDTEAWALEVNTAPGLGGTMPSLYATKFIAWKAAQA